MIYFLSSHISQSSHEHEQQNIQKLYCLALNIMDLNEDERSSDPIWSKNSVPRPFGPIMFPYDKEDHCMYHHTTSQHSSPASREPSFQQTRRDTLKSISSHMATILITLLVVTGIVSPLFNLHILHSLSSFSALSQL